MRQFYRRYRIYRASLQVWWYCRPRWSEMVVPERAIKMDPETSAAVKEVIASMRRLSGSVRQQVRQQAGQGKPR